MTTDIVIPAHNEAGTIAAVVNAATAAPSVGQVVVVADHCTDATADLARAAGADLVVELTNATGDKGTAMAFGLAQVVTSDVLFIDADLLGLVWQHVEALLIAEPKGGQVCGLRDVPYHFTSNRLPPITGERRIGADLARSVDLTGSGYRAEIMLNAAVGRAQLPHRNVVLVGVTNPTRATRHPLSWLTMWADLAFLGIVHAPALAAYAMYPEGLDR